MSDLTITKREILLSIAIVCIMLLLGFVIAGSINTSLMEKHQEYNTALQVNEDKDLFEYGMRTSIGNAFVYGELKAVDPVGYEGVDGDYSYIKKVKEKYTKHTRVVTKTRTVNGKTQTYTECLLWCSGTMQRYSLYTVKRQHDKRQSYVSLRHNRRNT